MRAVVIFLALAFSSPAAAQPIAGGDRVVGEWRGSSVCVNLQLLPACKNESVRYVFSAPPKGGKSYHVAADKLVSGAYQPMGEMDLTYNGSADVWTYEFPTGACTKCKWWFRIEASGLIGGLASPLGAALRQVSAMRQAP